MKRVPTFIPLADGPPIKCKGDKGLMPTNHHHLTMRSFCLAMKSSNQFSNLLASEKEAIEKGIEKRICPRIEDKIQQLMNEFAHTVNY